MIYNLEREIKRKAHEIVRLLRGTTVHTARQVLKEALILAEQGSTVSLDTVDYRREEEFANTVKTFEEGNPQYATGDINQSPQA
ncbi:MAG TPA: hypothetical protein VHO70_19840 [Chitinispirillaceae bacterium]|nr:hypothetical protein [Chitinispirillaceae bacterium]